MGNSTDASSEGWTFTEPWLIGILATVARQTHQKVGRRCFVTTEDIKQDLAFDAFTDPVLLAQLRSFKDEDVPKRRLITLRITPEEEIVAGTCQNGRG